VGRHGKSVADIMIPSHRRRNVHCNDQDIVSRRLGAAQDVFRDFGNVGPVKLEPPAGLRLAMQVFQAGRGEGRGREGQVMPVRRCCQGVCRPWPGETTHPDRRHAEGCVIALPEQCRGDLDLVGVDEIAGHKPDRIQRLAVSPHRLPESHAAKNIIPNEFRHPTERGALDIGRGGKPAIQRGIHGCYQYSLMVASHITNTAIG